VERFRTIVVLDIDRNALRKVRHPKMWAVAGDARHLPFKTGIFDRALSMDYQEHLEIADIPIYLKELHRSLTDFAVLGIFTSCRGFTIRRWLYSIAGRLPKGDLDWSDWAKDGHRNRLTASQHRDLVWESGFRLDRWLFASHFFDPLVRRFHLLAKYVAYRLLRIQEDPESAEEVYRKSNSNVLVESYFWILRWVAYLDCVLFGRIPGGSVFMRLVKNERR